MRKQSGFTLIELAIVLVIIGLLLGGVLKGQELINSAKVKSFASDFRNIPIYIYGYQDKFKALPGDDKNAVTHVSAAQPGNGDGVIGNSWSDDSSVSKSEAYNFWQHIRLAGLATGSTDVKATDWRPINADGGAIGIQSGTSTPASSPVIDGSGNAIKGTYVVCSSGILGKYVLQLDTTMDDGATDSGSMLATPVNGYNKAGGSKAVGSTAIDPALSYIVCFGI